jgi:hypothetical protein
MRRRHAGAAAEWNARARQGAARFARQVALLAGMDTHGERDLPELRHLQARRQSVVQEDPEEERRACGWRVRAATVQGYSSAS